MFLEQIAATGGHLDSVARSALGMVEDIRLSNYDPMYLSYLHELVEHIYQSNGLPLLDHLREGADCELCAALVSRVAE